MGMLDSIELREGGKKAFLLVEKILSTLSLDPVPSIKSHSSLRGVLEPANQDQNVFPDSKWHFLNVPFVSSFACGFNKQFRRFITMHLHSTMAGSTKNDNQCMSKNWPNILIRHWSQQSIRLDHSDGKEQNTKFEIKHGKLTEDSGKPKSLTAYHKISKNQIWPKVETYESFF